MILATRTSSLVVAVVFIGRLDRAVQQVFADGGQLRGLLLFLLFLALALLAALAL